KFAPVFELYIDLVRAFDHVEICEDVAIGPDDESRTFALDRLKIFLVSAWIIFVRWALEEQILERRSLGVVLFRDFDNDDTRRDDLENLRESVVQLMNDVLALFGRSRRNSRV